MKKNLLLLGLFVLLPFLSHSQNQPTINATLSGKIIDRKTQEPLVGASALIKGTTNGGITDANGKFLLSTGQKLPFTLVVSFIGYYSQEVIADKNTISIELAPNEKELNEIVVVGYTQTRRDAQTSAITTINSQDVSKASYTSITEKLQGQVPGLLISSNSGVPGTSVLVRLRGATSITAGNDPLYIIDGVFINNENLQGLSRGLGGQTPNPLSDLNPEDIESVSVLKDANATAIYGARGANGVILITTK